MQKSVQVPQRLKSPEHGLLNAAKALPHTYALLRLQRTAPP